MKRILFMMVGMMMLSSTAYAKDMAPGTLSMSGGATLGFTAICFYARQLVPSFTRLPDQVWQPLAEISHMLPAAAGHLQHKSRLFQYFPQHLEDGIPVAFESG